jgi:hypothetical protein
VARDAVIGGQISGAITITRAFRSVRYWRQSGLKDREIDSISFYCAAGVDFSASSAKHSIM